MNYKRFDRGLGGLRKEVRRAEADRGWWSNVANVARRESQYQLKNR